MSYNGLEMFSTEVNIAKLRVILDVTSNKLSMRLLAQSHTRTVS
jgi:hypothetical protein